MREREEQSVESQYAIYCVPCANVEKCQWKSWRWAISLVKTIKFFWLFPEKRHFSCINFYFNWSLNVRFAICWKLLSGSRSPVEQYISFPFPFFLSLARVRLSSAFRLLPVIVMCDYDSFSFSLSQAHFHWNRMLLINFMWFLHATQIYK